MRNPKALLRRPAVRRLSAAAATLSVAGVLIAAAASPASADTSVTVTYPISGGAFIKSIKTTESLGPGTLTSTIDLNTSTLTADLALPAATVSYKEWGFIPVSVGTELIQQGSATGTADLSTNTVSTTATSVLKIDSLKVAGLNIPIGSNCQSGLITTTITSQAGFNVLNGGTLAGSFTIPKFSGCGLIATPLINLTVPGGGNTLTLTLGAAT